MAEHTERTEDERLSEAVKNCLKKVSEKLGLENVYLLGIFFSPKAFFHTSSPSSSTLRVLIFAGINFRE